MAPIWPVVAKMMDIWICEYIKMILRHEGQRLSLDNGFSPPFPPVLLELFPSIYYRILHGVKSWCYSVFVLYRWQWRSGEVDSRGHQDGWKNMWGNFTILGGLWQKKAFSGFDLGVGWRRISRGSAHKDWLHGVHRILCCSYLLCDCFCCLSLAQCFPM